MEITVFLRWHKDLGLIVARTVPIRLSPKASGMLPFARVKLVVGRGVRVASDPQQGAERVERIEPPVEAKREFIEVRL